MYLTHSNSVVSNLLRLAYSLPDPYDYYTAVSRQATMARQWLSERYTSCSGGLLHLENG